MQLRKHTFIISISLLRTKSSNRSISLGATEPRISNVNDIYGKKKIHLFSERTRQCTKCHSLSSLKEVISNITQGYIKSNAKFVQVYVYVKENNYWKYNIHVHVK